MSRRRAPTALRMPISRVRSVTLTSMMFMMPMPPTSRADGDHAAGRQHEAAGELLDHLHLLLVGGEIEVVHVVAPESARAPQAGAEEFLSLRQI